MSRDMKGLDWRTHLDGDGVAHLCTLAHLVSCHRQWQSSRITILLSSSLFSGKTGKLVCFHGLTTFIVEKSFFAVQPTHAEAAFQGCSLVFMTERPVIGAEKKNSDFELKKVKEI
ncbi:hypothetical protein AAC387_Pa11g0325 [Persea americana]